MTKYEGAYTLDECAVFYTDYRFSSLGLGMWQCPGWEILTKRDYEEGIRDRFKNDCIDIIVARCVISLTQLLQCKLQQSLEICQCGYYETAPKRF